MLMYKERQCTYNVTLLDVQITTVAMAIQQCVACTVEQHVMINNIKILNVAKKYFYGEFILLATIKYT
jgi:hypothetical protein